MAATGGGGLRRLDQCGAAPAGDRPRMRDRGFDLHDVAEIFRRTPYIADLKPGGRYVAKDMFRDRRRAGADEGAARTGGFLHGDCITVTGKTIAEKIWPTWSSPPIRTSSGRPATHSPPLGRRRRAEGHAGAAGSDREGRRHEDPEVPRHRPLLRQRGEGVQGGPRPGSIRKATSSSSGMRGPRGGPGMREMLSTTAAIYGQAWVTRWR